MRVSTSNAWVIPADQHSKTNAAEAVAGLQAQGVEIHRATGALTAGGVAVKAGDCIIRGDQPYRTVVDMYFAVQDYSMSNPSPYDDLGWTYPMMRNIVSHEINDKAILTAAMAPVTGPIRAAGGISGTGTTVIVDHTGDNLLAQFRFQFAGVPMQSDEAAFDAAGRTFGAGAIIIPNANRAQLEPAAVSPIGLLVTGLAAAGGAWLYFSGTADKAIDWLTTRFGQLVGFVRTVAGGIGDALLAGDVQLAARIVWSAVKVAFYRGLQELANVWSSVQSAGADAWINVRSVAVPGS